MQINTGDFGNNMANSARKILAANVVKYRRKRGLTQKELAALTNMSVSFMSGIENGRMNVSIDNVETLAGVLRVKTFELLKPEA